MRLEPCNGAIITRERKRDQITKSGILLPGFQDKSGKSITKNVVLEVLQIGPGERGKSGARVPIDSVAIGDLVLCDRRSIQSLYVDGDGFYAVSEDVIIAKVFEPDSRIMVPEVEISGNVARIRGADFGEPTIVPEGVLESDLASAVVE